MWFIVVCTLIDNGYASLLFSQTIFPYCFCMLSEFAKVFERKVWRVQVAHLHNAAHTLSSRSRCFQLSKNMLRFLSLSLIIIIIIYPLHASWHIGPSQSFSTPLDWLLRSAPPPLTLSDEVLPQFPLWNSEFTLLLVSVIILFYGRGLSALCPTPNLEGQWDHSLSGPYPLTCFGMGVPARSTRLQPT